MEADCRLIMKERNKFLCYPNAIICSAWATFSVLLRTLRSQHALEMSARQGIVCTMPSKLQASGMLEPTAQNETHYFRIQESQRGSLRRD